MIRKAKRSSANNDGSGLLGSILGRRALVTRGASSGADGSGAPSRRRSPLAVAAVACALATFVMAPAAFANNKVVAGNIGTGSGSAGGNLSGAKGMAVNQNGTGGAGAGDVYVVDAGNNRISQFSATGTFVRAFGRNVVSSGPGNNNTAEVQSLAIQATSGTFTLKFSGQTTGALAYNVPASGGVGATASVQNALEALSTIGAGNVTVAGSAPYVVTFAGTMTGKNVEQIAINTSGLGIAVGTQLSCTGGPSNATLSYQWLANGTSLGSANGAQTPTYTVQAGDAGKVIQCQVSAINTAGTAAANQVSSPTLATEIVSSPYPGTAPPTTTLTNLAAPSVVGGGQLTAAGKKLSCAAGAWTGSPTFAFQWYRNGVALVGNGANTNEYTVQAADVSSAAVFQCAVTATNVGGAATLFSANRNTAVPLPFPFSPPTATASALGPIVSSTSIEGSGVEVCNTGVDVCQAGESSGLAGSLAGIQGVAIDQSNGNLYITSNTNRRVDVYSATGKFEGAFGWKVNASSPEEKLQLCTVATGCQAGVSGAAAGQLAALQNSGPAVSPVNGHLYVPDPGNQRVDEFVPTLNGSKEVSAVVFDHAFGRDVTPSINEQQTVTLTGATGGVFSLSFEGEMTGAAGSGNVTSGSNEIAEPVASEGAFVVGEAISGAGIPAGATITSVNTGSLTISANATASNAAVPLTARLPFNAPASVVQNALAALPIVGTSTSNSNSSSNILVSGAAGGPWTMEFAAQIAGQKTGKFKGVNVPQMTVDGSLLTGSSPSAAVTTIQAGANGAGVGLEQCTFATTCQVGVNGSAQLNKYEGGFGPNEPTSAAVDATGAVYAVSESAGGTCLITLETQCRVQKFNAAGTTVEEFAPSQLTVNNQAGNAATPNSIAVDPATGHIFAAKRSSTSTSKLLEFNASGDLVSVSPLGGGSFTGTFGLAVGIAERLYFGEKVLGPGPAPKAVTMEHVSGIGATTATLSGRVALPEGGFPTFAYFEYSSDGVTWSKAPAEEEISLGNGSGAGSAESCPTGNPPVCNVNQTVTELTPNTTYVVRLVGTAGTPLASSTMAFKTTGAAPSISRTVAEPVTETSATLTSYVNPNAQSTTYHFEWGGNTGYGTRIPADFDAVAGSGAQAVKVTANVSNLAGATPYHFRLVATNASGTSVGSDQEFITLNSAGLPDNRRFELVSPADKRPQGRVFAFGNSPIGFQAAADGESAVLPIQNGFEGSSSGGELRYLATRGPSSWNSVELSPPSLITNPNRELATTGQIAYASPDLSCMALETFNPLTADTPSADIELGVTNLYTRSSDGSHTLVTNNIPTNPSLVAQTAATYVVKGASSDCSRIFFQTKYKFFPGTPSGLYEWDNGKLYDAGVLPNGAVGASASLPEAINAVSSSGHFFFEAVSNEGGDSGKRALFLRKGPATAGGNGDLSSASATISNIVTTTGSFSVGQTITGAGIPAGTTISALGVTTLTLSQPATATASAVSIHASQVVDVSQKQGGAGNSTGATYQIASPDGRHVFFTANSGLTPTSSSTGTDFYDYNVDTGVLKDLSADSNPADVAGAAVRGATAVSNDGSYVYFIADGQLIPGKGKTYSQNQSGQTANLYLAHDGERFFVATIAISDLARSSSPSEENEGGSNLSRIPSRNAQASNNGHRLLFTSAANIVGYDSGGVEEAYIYSTDSGKTECVSCRPDGLPAAKRPKDITEPLSVVHSFAAAQYEFPRSMSEDGSRVFFTSPDVLAPGAVLGAYNLYEWENGQVYLLHPFSGDLPFPAFRAAGGSGDDVFVNTPERLDPHDFDFTYDVYDIRADGGYPPPSQPVSCDPAADECQGTPAPAPAAPAPASADFAGPGNAPGQPPGKRKHPKKHHKKSHKGHQKQAGHGRGGKK